MNAAVLFLFSSFIIALFGIYLAWTHPLADDLARAALSRDSGVFSGIKQEYLSWTGRWLGIAVPYAIFSVIGNINYYSLSLITFFLIHLLAFLVFSTSLLNLPIYSLKSLHYSVFFYSVFLACMPSIREGIYWMTGGTENVLPISLAIIFVAFALKNKGPYFSGKKAWLSLVYATAAFVIPGFHELFGILFLLLLVILTVIFFRSKDESRLFWFMLVISCAFGLAFVVLAPGNYVRLGPSPLFGEFASTASAKFADSFRATKSYVTFWVCSPTFVILSSTLAFLPHIPRTFFKGGWRDHLFLSFVIIFVTFLLVFLGFFIVYCLIGIMPERTLNGLYLICILGWFLAIFVIVSKISLILPKSIVNVATSVSIGIFIYTMLSIDRVKWCIDDVHLGCEFRKAMVLRDNTIARSVSEGIENVYIDDRISWPRNFPRHIDISEDSNDFRNWHWAMYFRAKSIHRRPLVPYVSDISLEIGPKKELGFGDLEGPYGQWGMLYRVRWMLGRSSEIRFFCPHENNQHNIYRLLLSVHGYVNDQRLGVYLNGVQICTLKVSTDWSDVITDGFSLLEGLNTLTFRASTSSTEQFGIRELSILFRQISFEKFTGKGWGN